TASPALTDTRTTPLAGAPSGTCPATAKVTAVTAVPVVQAAAVRSHRWHIPTTATNRQCATSVVTGHGQGASGGAPYVAATVPAAAAVATPMAGHAHRAARTTAMLWPAASTIASAG